MYEITVAVCVYKQKEWLHRCLRSLNSQTLEKSRYEVVVVNDDPNVLRGKNKVPNIESLKDVDIVSINCGLNDTSRNLITYDTFKDFKKGLVVVNTSRGEVVDERYISLLIKSREIFYSADVIVDEQNISTPHHSELYKLYESEKYDNLTLTPHVAGVTTDSQEIAFRSILDLCMKSL